MFDEEAQIFEAADTALTEKDGAFVGGKNRFTAEFSKDKTNDELFKITDGAHRVTVLAVKSGRGHEAVAAELVKTVADEAVSVEASLADKVIFDKAEEKADLVYSLTASGVKEDIVIKERADVYRYSFLLRCENVAAEFDE